MDNLDDLVGGLLGQTDNSAKEPDPKPETETKTAAPADDVKEDNSPSSDDVSDNSDNEPDASDITERDDQDATKEPTEETEPEFEIASGDNSSKVKLSELKSGYLRQSDYTRKTQEIADQRKQLEAELAAQRTKRDQYDAVLTQLQQRLGSDGQERTEAQWNELRASDPQKYAAEYTDHLRRGAQRDALRKEQERIANERKTEHETRVRTFVDGERQKLVAALPELGDKAKGPALISEIRQFAKDTFGFSDAELDQAYDSRIILGFKMAMDGMKATKAAATAKEKLAAAPELPKPGPKVQTTTKSAMQRARAEASKRLEKTGSLDDALALILDRK